MADLAHMISVAAIWTMMLTGLRFAVAAIQWLRPARRAYWRLLRCSEPGQVKCRADFRVAIDQLHTDLRHAMTTPWSASLLFVGSAFIGFAFMAGSAGDIAVAISSEPDRWRTFDVVGDCIAALLAVTGMAFVQAVTASHRTVSLLMSAGLVLTGLGIGGVTL